jgi:hypothetical protein
MKKSVIFLNILFLFILNKDTKVAKSNHLKTAFCKLIIEFF